ncbi:SDR family NAD(P)-dependent oxidoreductase [Hyphomonas johnsonii]|uniref:Short-chain dehydrogenase/reductase SDR n=1 Tax=Hyphomonas johnsonii MHS-2 TaxID=1280950 RepID=A0A059FU90_9PROT|nr:SDR family NAD(P)-dependent oxidoreductase [Hyphomonas johnsonii]KCZ94275.1 short-chain dehydrogenase/reductase SDR [Hyphomonas johnsonii MHS-2]
MRFKGKAALVTGAGKGIGEATAIKLASEGASVLCADRDEIALDDTVRAIVASGGTAVGCHTDVSEAKQVDAMVSMAVERFGGLHLAVNNAGIGGPEKPLAEQALEDWKRVLDVNLNGVFYGLKYEIPAIIAAGGGAIVNVASMFARHALRGHAHYTASKYAVVGLTRTAAVDYANHPIRINTVCPGVIDTPLSRSGGDTSAGIAQMIPQGRLGEAREVANMIAFLLSEEASYVTASEFDVDGGILH